ncbi:HEAT repeat domain-containing protein [Pseudorhizobium flavum]|uniref:HEAT repeat domain-containing protein n=1 Tax=Pseudorhizobium flavum TaxID=1335061 RepID=UPI00376FADF9
MSNLFKIVRAGMLTSALAVSGGTSSAFADVTARYGELQAVIDAINDPDPLMRLAQLEAILKKGDATEVQLAIRTAFQLDDPNVRSLALRAHFASFRTFLITAELPEKIQKEMEDENSGWYDNYLYKYLRSMGYQFKMQSEYPSTDELEFQIKALNGNFQDSDQKKYTGTGNIRGGMLTVVSNVYKSGSPQRCSFEFTEYHGFTMAGMASCDMDYSFQFPVRFHLFDDDSLPKTD